MKNIVLIGMMGAGKTTIGKLLAEKLTRELVDMDAVIVQREGREISEIFAVDGENYFRELEHRLAGELAQREGLIIACGGGLPTREPTIQLLEKTGIVVFLRRDPGETYDSVPMEGRPLGQDGRAAFLARFAAREPIYRRWADVVVTDFSSPAATVGKILEALA